MLPQKRIVLPLCLICQMGAALVLGGQRLAADPVRQAGKVPICEDCNIVFVAFDTLRADYNDLLDRDASLMPAVERLSARGITFTQAIAASSWTLPATMSWFTGVSPSRHGLTNKYPPDAALDGTDEVWTLKTRTPELATLAEVFRNHGYRTGGFTGGAGVHHEFGFDLGFEFYFDDIPFGGFRDTVPRALEWVREHHDEQLFVFLHGYDCHGQYAPVGGWDYRYTPPTYDGPYTGTKEERKLLRQEGLEKEQLFLRDEDIAFWKGMYAERVERADQGFARFLRAYEHLGLMDKTIWVITSDHGEELMEHGRLDHGPTLYEEIVRVPLIIVVPGLAESMRIDHQVRSIDLMPTLLALAGITPPEPVRAQWQGSDIFHPDIPPGDALIETDYRYYTFLSALREAGDTPWKLVLNRETVARELFDLSEDPQEQHNLSLVKPDKARQLAERLQNQ